MSNETAIPRWCANCRYVMGKRGLPREHWQCSHPKVQTINPVDGSKEQVSDGICERLRGGIANCGFDGRWFEAADEPQEGNK